MDDDTQGDDQPSGIRPTNRAREIAEFLEFIRTNGGTKEYEKALRTMFAKELETGLVTLQGLSSGMQQLAKGLPANPADFARGMSMGLLQFGYGMIASWVQSSIEDAIARMSNKRIANIGSNDVPVRGDAKCNINKKNGTAELYLRNENNTVTVLTLRNSAGLTGGTYKVW